MGLTERFTLVALVAGCLATATSRAEADTTTLAFGEAARPAEPAVASSPLLRPPPLAPRRWQIDIPWHGAPPALPSRRPAIDPGVATTLLVAGIVLPAAGPVAIASGLGLLWSGNDDGGQGLDDHQRTGVGLMVGGGVSVAIGIPLLIVGARTRRESSNAAFSPPRTFRFSSRALRRPPMGSKRRRRRPAAFGPGEMPTPRMQRRAYGVPLH
jgi:hypothetical protein